MLFKSKIFLFLPAFVLVTLFAGTLIVRASLPTPPEGGFTTAVLDPGCLPTDPDCVVRMIAPGNPNFGIQYNNNGVFGADNLFTRNPNNTLTNIFSNFLVSSGDVYTVETRTLSFFIDDLTGEFIDGETIINEQGGTATLLGLTFVGGGYIGFFDDITGDWDTSDSLVTGQTSNATMTFITFVPNSFSVGTNILFSDFDENISGTGTITDIQGDTFTIVLNEGNPSFPGIIISNADDDNSVRIVYAISLDEQLSNVTSEILSGFTSTNNLFNMGFPASGLFSQLENGDEFFAGFSLNEQIPLFAIGSLINGDVNGYRFPVTMGQPGQALVLNNEGSLE